MIQTYLRVESCENGYILTLVETDESGDMYHRDEIRWIATTTSEAKEMSSRLIEDHLSKESQ